MHYPLKSFRFLDHDMLMCHFGGGIGHLSQVMVLLQDSEPSSDSDSAMDTDSEPNLHSAALNGEGGFENNSESDSDSMSSTSSLDDDSHESDLDLGDNGYDSL